MGETGMARYIILTCGLSTQVSEEDLRMDPVS